MVDPLAVQDGQHFLRLIELSAEFARASVSFADTRGRPALRREKRLTEADLQSELLSLAHSAISRVMHETQPLAQQRLSLLHRGSRQSPVDFNIGPSILSALAVTQIANSVRI